tara:strand:- start:23 stop:181 length:159 start_codon:yes stop_codon:yes gene_type:complete
MIMNNLAQFNLVNFSALLAGWALHDIEPILTVLALLSAITYNIIKIIKETKK